MGARALERLGELKAGHRTVGDVRGLGLLLGIELVSERERKTPAPAAETVMYRGLERGLSFETTMGSVLTLTPPLIITQVEMARALAILDDCPSEVERERTGQAAG